MTALDVSWPDFDQAWVTWRDEQPLTRSRRSIPGRNFIADENLGTWDLPGGATVEIATGVFLGARSIGVTRLFPNGGHEIAGVVHSFEELETLLHSLNLPETSTP